MKTIRTRLGLVLALVAGIPLLSDTPAVSSPPAAPASPAALAAAAVTAAKGANPARGHSPASPGPTPVIPVNPRYGQVRDKIARLFHTDAPLSPVNDPKGDPFRSAVSGPAAGTADGGSLPGSAAGGDTGATGPARGPEAPPGAPDEFLRRTVLGLKVGGVSVLNGVARISVDGTPHRQGDYVKAGSRGSPTWLQISEITPTSVTFRLRDAGPDGPKFTLRF